MMIDQIKGLIGNPESTRLAYKPTMPSSVGLAKLISSFANTEGGYIVLGVAVPSNGEIEINGLSTDFNPSKTLKKAKDKLQGNIELSSNFITKNSSSLFVINIVKAKENVTLDGLKYIRIGNQIIQQNEVEFRGAIKRNKEAWENTIGRYIALIIGINQYTDPNLSNLSNPNNDAELLATVLKENYNFKITLIKNTSRDEILDALDALEEQLEIGDNLLIFYAGHGHWEENIFTGFWLPKDAEEKRRKNWIENSTIHNYINRFQKCQHVLLISDSCFSGALMDSRSPSLEDAKTSIQTLYERKSRSVITSGAKEKVPDKSVFFKLIYKEFIENKSDFFSAFQLFSKIKEEVIQNSPNHQIPQKEKILRSEDNGGDFIFCFSSNS